MQKIISSKWGFILLYMVIFVLYILSFAYARDGIVVLSLVIPCIAFFQKKRAMGAVAAVITIILVAYNVYSRIEQLEAFRFQLMKPIYQCVADDIINRSHNLNDMLGVICDVEGNP